MECNVGEPQVAYREAITQAATVEYTHKKQSGGSGQYAKIKIDFAPKDDDTDSEVEICGGGGGGQWLIAAAAA